MKKLMVWVLALAGMCGTAAQAQDVAGNWQGTLSLGSGRLRMVVKVAKSDKDGWTAMLYNADRGTQPVNTSSVVVDGGTFRFSADLMGVKYEGKLSADGTTITGTWTFSGSETPLTLVKATPETMWVIPKPPEAMKPSPN